MVLDTKKYHNKYAVNCQNNAPRHLDSSLRLLQFISKTVDLGVSSLLNSKNISELLNSRSAMWISFLAQPENRHVRQDKH